MDQKLIILPIQVIEQDDGIILKRGLEQMLIPDKNALLIIRVIQKALLQQPRSADDLLTLFTGPIRPLISNLIDHLIKKRFLLMQSDGMERGNIIEESAQDIFYWHFNLHQQQIASILNEKCWVFVGINQLTQELLQVMLNEGLDNYCIVDDPMLRNIDNFDANHQLTSEFWQKLSNKIISEDEVFAGDAVQIFNFGFVVAASEFGSFYLLERWNQFAVESGLSFYPVLLQNMVGYAGPLVIPHETACFACLKARQNSQNSSFEERRQTEKYAFAGQKVVAYHQSMLKVLAAVAQFDLIKFKSNIQWEVGTLCEMDLLGGSMTRRKLLKAPRCPICSGLHDVPLVNVYKRLTSSQDWDEIRQTVGNYEN